MLETAWFKGLVGFLWGFIEMDQMSNTKSAQNQLLMVPACFDLKRSKGHLPKVNQRQHPTANTNAY